jgi:hypothetical protein
MHERGTTNKNDKMKNKSNKTNDNKNGKNGKAVEAPAPAPAAAAPAPAKAERKKARKEPTVKPMKERHVARWNALTRRALGHGVADEIESILKKGCIPQLTLKDGKLGVELLAPATA